MRGKRDRCEHRWADPLGVGTRSLGGGWDGRRGRASRLVLFRSAACFVRACRGQPCRRPLGPCRATSTNRMRAARRHLKLLSSEAVSHAENRIVSRGRVCKALRPRLFFLLWWWWWWSSPLRRVCLFTPKLPRSPPPPPTVVALGRTLGRVVITTCFRDGPFCIDAQSQGHDEAISAPSCKKGHRGNGPPRPRTSRRLGRCRHREPSSSAL
jgi:hypothetical protein